MRVDGEELPADHVVMATGVRPATGLARDAGLELGDSGALRVDDHQRCPGHDGVFAAGDCVESWHRVLERPMNVQLGTHANKQGRIAGANATGADLAFPGVIGTAASKICRYEVARTGITEREAADAGIEVRAATIKDRTRAGYYPGSGPIWVKLVVGARRAPARRADRRHRGRGQAHRRPRRVHLDGHGGRRARAARPRPTRRPTRASTTRSSSRRGRRRRPCSYDARAQIRSSSRGRSSTISSPRVPSRRTRGDAALLEVDARAGEVVDDLGEVGLVADDEHALVRTGGGQQLERVGDVEAREQRGVLDRLDAEGLAGQHRGVARADLRAREGEVDVDLQRGQRAARDARLLAAAVGEAAVGVGPRVVGLGLAVPQEPELLRHAPGRLPGVGASALALDAHPQDVARLHRAGRRPVRRRRAASGSGSRRSP